MNKVLWCVLCVVCLLGSFPIAAAATNDGVLSGERVINLPQDQAKLYVSVVGDAADIAYQRVQGWFSTHSGLKNIKDRVHFRPVTTDSVIYKERYAANVRGLPTVRVQLSDGVVIYEAARAKLPTTAEGLYGTIASSIADAQNCRPVLPWRREQERRCPCPSPQPEPQPTPPPDPEPEPLNDGDVPIDSPQPAPWVLALLCVGGFAGGLSVSYGKQLYRKLHPVK